MAPTPAPNSASPMLASPMRSPESATTRHGQRCSPSSTSAWPPPPNELTPDKPVQKPNSLSDFPCQTSGFGVVCLLGKSFFGVRQLAAAFLFLASAYNF